MAEQSSAAADDLGPRFLQLPRELRDVIYSFIVLSDGAIKTTDRDKIAPPYVQKDGMLELTKRIIDVPVDHPMIRSEWLEAIYSYSKCSITFTHPTLLRENIFPHKLFGNHPENKTFIRTLVVYASEAVLLQDDPESAEKECVFRKPEVRQEWNELLQLPRLESLTINMQKKVSSGFVWANFAPILYELRERIPKLRITFNVSLDVLLENKWNIDLAQSEQLREWIPRDTEDDPYLPMGYVDISDLTEPPTDEDRAYVKEHLPDTRDVGSNDPVRGLLDETPQYRRLLTKHYLVKEPALLRMLMAEQYEIYKRVRKEREERAAASGEAVSHE